MPCRVYEQVNRWGDAPPQAMVRMANQAHAEVQSALVAALGAEARCWIVRAAGSFNNGTATVCSSDVDLHLLRCDRFAYRLPDPSPVREAIEASLICPVECGFVEERQRVEAAMRQRFGQWVEERPKAMKIGGTEARLDADVVVGLVLRRYTGDVDRCGGPVYLDGVELRSREDAAAPVVCYPELRRQEIDAHDRSAGGRYRPIVRILKCVRQSFRRSGEPALVEAAAEIPSCLLEAVLARVPAAYFHVVCSSHWCVLNRVIPRAIELVGDPGRASSVWDLGGVDRLFGPDKTWSREHLHGFLEVAWARLQAHDIPLEG